MAINLPVKAESIPSKILTKPAPPESTTPTSFKTGRRSGVCLSEALASDKKYLKASTMSVSDLTKFFNEDEDSLITVRIVPSTGLITAL